MRLLLLRHAKADRPAGGTDHDRPLARRGREDAERLGARLAADGLLPDRVIVSDALRTRQTCERVLAGAKASPPVAEEPRLYEATSAAILAVLAEADLTGTVLAIGHNPGFHETAARLAGGGDREGLMRLREGFPTAALAVFDLPDGTAPTDGAARLERFILPDGKA
jgi:phosphohistidine phosphatase